MTTVLAFIGGGIVGAIAASMFLNKDNIKADEHRKAGNEAYRKAANSLEIARTERNESHTIICEILRNIINMLKQIDATDSTGFIAGFEQLIKELGDRKTA